MWISYFSIFDLLGALPAHSQQEATRPIKVEPLGRKSTPRPAGALLGLCGRCVVRVGRRGWSLGAMWAQYHMARPGGL